MSQALQEPPTLKSVRPVRPLHRCRHGAARVLVARRTPRDDPRSDLRRLVALSRPQGRTHGQRVDPRGRHLDDVVQGVQDLRRQGREHPREQHRADRGLGGRVHRLRRRRDHAGDHDPRLRPRVDACGAGVGARRAARHPDDDPAPARAHRGAARQAQVSGRDGLCRGPQGWRVRGAPPRPSRGAGGALALGAQGVSARTISFGLDRTRVQTACRRSGCGRTAGRSSRRRSMPASAESRPGAGRGLHHRAAGGLAHGRRWDPAYLVLIP